MSCAKKRWWRSKASKDGGLLNRPSCRISPRLTDWSACANSWAPFPNKLGKSKMEFPTEFAAPFIAALFKRQSSSSFLFFQSRIFKFFQFIIFKISIIYIKFSSSYFLLFRIWSMLLNLKLEDYLFKIFRYSIECFYFAIFRISNDL